MSGYLIAFFAGITGALGFVFYIFALKIGKVSVVSVMTSGYPIVSILLAILILQDQLSLPQILAISMVIGAMILLSIPEGARKNDENGKKKSMRWLFWTIMSMLFWGIWAIPSKIAIGAVGEGDYILIDGLTMVLIWFPLWLWMEKGKLSRDIHKLKYSSIGGCLASLGTVSLFLALSNGQVSIVTPLTSVYPIFTVVLARFTLKERLIWIQYLAVAIGVTGTVLLAL